jgi:Flp pilus assembly protein TadD
LSLSPENPEYEYDVAHVLNQFGQFAEARVHAERALKLRPEYAPGYFSLGLALAGLGDPAGAIVQLEQAAKLRPDEAAIRDKLEELRKQVRKSE